MEQEKNPITCAECGELLREEEDAHEVNGDYYCESCYYENFSTCEYCGEIIANDDVISVYNERGHTLYYCEHCADYNADVCDDCNERFTPAAIELRDANRAICYACAHNWIACAECDEVVWHDAAHFYDGAEYCEYCYNHLDRGYIRDYSFKPMPEFLSGANRATELYMGVELEIDGGNDPHECARELTETAAGRVYIKHDGSLSDTGIEIVTHPATLDYHAKKMQWPELCDIAKSYGYKSHDTSTCGLHVHVDRRYLGDSPDRRELVETRIVLLVWRLWEDLVTFSRRDPSRLNRWAQKPRTDEIHADDPEDVIIEKCKAVKKYGRYQAVNLENRATVELRFFRGTLKASTIIATLQLVQILVDAAKRLSTREIMAATWEKLIESTSYPELKTYLENLKKRGK